MSYEEEDSAASFLEKLIVKNSNLVYLEERFPEVKVILAGDYEKTAKTSSNVAVIATANNNVDPLLQNSLSAATYGAHFRSPSPETILSAIRAVTTQYGCLLLVQDCELSAYQAAAKTAKEQGFIVDILSTRRRIQLDTILAAGAAAAKGLDLYHVKEEARNGLLSTKSKIKQVWDGEKKCHECGADSLNFTSHNAYIKHRNEMHKNPKF